MESHFYLVAYHSERGQFLEFRIDRIQEQPLQIKPQLTGTATIRPRAPTVWPVLSPPARSGRQACPKHLEPEITTGDGSDPDKLDSDWLPDEDEQDEEEE
ncbi:hypothetical protein [Thermogemmatispora sp.]|uniref:hypothetical protein n=1 Tax=Thermogemmatispora sp. TaxID=1968838 RepID=UPI001D90FB84|nr:hypothetical protein [Thermogemmatispora sp.]MBX5451713.1 hypothetical protein [Thermogemmatispora sp.]